MSHKPAPIFFPPLLLATDGSPSAQFAQKLLCQFVRILPTADNNQILVTALTVQPRRSSRSNRLISKIRRTSISSSGTEPAPQPPGSGVLEGASENSLSNDKLTELIRSDFPEDFPISMQIRPGRPATEILNCASANQAGLIAIGFRGTGGVRQLLLGSVSAVVARFAPCSVLVARSSTADPEPKADLTHVLLVVGADHSTRAAIAATRQLIPLGIQRVTILYIQPLLNANYLFGPFVAPNPSWQLKQSLQEVQKEQGEGILQQAKAALDFPDVDIQTLWQTSEPGPLICQVAQQQGVNLVILGSGTKRRSLLPSLNTLRKHKPDETGKENHRPVLRNVRLSATEDYTIHHAPCPVLLCRPNQPMTERGLTE